MRVRCLSACPKCSVAMDTIVNNYKQKNESSDTTTDETKTKSDAPKPSSTDTEPEAPLTPSKFTSIG